MLQIKAKKRAVEQSNIFFININPKPTVTNDRNAAINATAKGSILKMKKKKALTKQAYTHHLSTAAQLRVSAEAFRAEALDFELKAKARCAGRECAEAMRLFDKAIACYKKAAKLDVNMFNVIDKDFVQIYKKLPGEKDAKKIPKTRKDPST